MGQYGPVATSSLLTTDLIAPGMPVFVSATQTNNTTIRLVIALPTMDANGANLTGLTKLSVASAVMTGGTNPFESKSMTEILAMTGVTKTHVTVTPTEAGQQKTVDVPVANLGGMQAFAAACSD